MISRIAAALRRQHQVSFSALRASCSSRHDVSVAFLAILLLIRRQAIVASQPTLFGPITLSRPESQTSPHPESSAEREISLLPGGD
jgi:chromatin segregation and condensation protein Rec8/ScpA/Scc1 (kleisin family)